MKTAPEILHHLVEVCWNCAEAAAKCANYCVGKQGMSKCLHLCHRCFEVCMQCVKECERNHAVEIKSLEACIAACEASAAECDKHNNPLCRRCADACRICAEQCKKDTAQFS